MKHVVIAGGGFAGLHLARKLRKNKDISVTVINPTPDFRYSPALYRAVVGFKMGIAKIPIDWALLDCPNAILKVATVTGLNADEKSIITDRGEIIAYDQVVFALGAKTTFFGIKGLPELSYGIKTPDEVAKLKQHIHDNLISNNQVHNYVIVGAGATGVELSGAMASYLKRISRHHKVAQSQVKLHLVEAAPRILGLMSERASKKVTKQLKKLGVKLYLNTKVNAETAHTLQTSNGAIKTDTVIWTAGVQSSEFYKDYPRTFSLDKRGKVVVDRHLSVSPSIYVCGDNASTKFSGLALVAVWHASFIAKDIKARMHNKKRPSYIERSPAQVIPAGNGWGVMQYKGLVISGFIVGLVRRVADFVAYRDVIGTAKALTIWTNSDMQEESCTACRR